MRPELRKWEFSDGPALVRAANDPLVGKYLRDSFPSPYTEDDALQFITYCLNTPDDLELNRAIVLNGQAVFAEPAHILMIAVIDLAADIARAAVFSQSLRA